MMVASVVLSEVMTFFGLILAIGLNLPPGAIVSVVMGAMFISAISVKVIYNKIVLSTG